MKNILLIVTAFVCWSCIDEPLNPQLNAVFLADIFFIDEEEGWAVGSQGSIFHTGDGGESWQKQQSYVTADLLAVTFTDKSTGWAAGSNGTILKTVNGGVVWSKANSGTSAFIKGIHAFDADTVIMVGSDGLILSTVNAGTGWRKDTLLKSLSDYNSVFFIDRNNGWAAGNAAAERSYNYISTTDGGLTWDTTLSDKESYFSDIFFVNLNTAFRSSGKGIEKSSDAGKTWTFKWQPVSGTAAVIEDLDIGAAGFAAGGYSGYNVGIALIGGGNGETWSDTFDKKELLHIYALKFVSAAEGFAVGGNGLKIYKTSDGGLTWKDRSP